MNVRVAIGLFCCFLLAAQSHSQQSESHVIAVYEGKRLNESDWRRKLDKLWQKCAGKCNGRRLLDRMAQLDNQFPFHGTVVVDKPGVAVTLVLASYSPVKWTVEVKRGSSVVGAIVTSIGRTAKPRIVGQKKLPHEIVRGIVYGLYNDDRAARSYANWDGQNLSCSEDGDTYESSYLAALQELQTLGISPKTIQGTYAKGVFEISSTTPEGSSVTSREESGLCYRNSDLTLRLGRESNE